MAWAEKYGTKGKWRARYLKPDGTIGSEPGFKNKTAAKNWGNDQESKIRNREKWSDPKKAKEPVSSWVAKWRTAQDLAESTMAKYNHEIDKLILPHFGSWEIGNITPIDVAIWEKKLRDAGYSHWTVAGAHARLHTILDDAVINGLIPSNPAVRKRRRGQDHAGADAAAESLWATPLQVLLIAERCAILTGRDADFVLPVMAAYCGTRWAESIGLEKPYCRANLHKMIRIEWHLVEVNGTFYRRHPKKASQRDIELPPFLTSQMTAAHDATTKNRCKCTHQDHPNELIYLGPKNGHPRRGNYDERIFRPACDGVHPARKKGEAPRPVLVDAANFPGTKLPPWPYAVAGEQWSPPRGPGRRRMDDDGAPMDGLPLASWLPIVKDLTFHDLRHSQKTWMIEDGIPEVASAERLGHKLQGVRGIYSHVSAAMRQQILNALQVRWENALRERAAMCPRSPVGVLDRLLEKLPKTTASPTLKMISTLPPITAESPTRVIGG